jgi:hypothetical protein
MKSFLWAIAAAALTLSLSLPASADNLDPATAKRLHDYVLSMDKIRAMQAATDELNKAAATDPSLLKVSDNQANAPTLAVSIAQLKANTRVIVFYQRHGLSADDVCLIPFVLIDVGMVTQYPNLAKGFSDRVSPAQIAFYKQHAGEMSKMTWLTSSGSK